VAIHDCDVCFISWEQIVKELNEHHANSVLAKWGFWRIIIDEAQVLQINYGEDGDLLNELWRRKLWLLSGALSSGRLLHVPGQQVVCGCCLQARRCSRASTSGSNT
jgi:E3 ubiquitin-protein ligase SHPRH